MQFLRLQDLRVVTAALALCALLTFELGPTLIQLDASLLPLWTLSWWVVVPAVGAAMCFAAARASSDHDRSAWFKFGFGSALWAAGIVAWQFIDLPRQGAFPGISDAAFLVTCFFYVSGIYHSSIDGRSVTKVQIANLVLTLLAAAVAGVLLLLPILRSSVLPPLGTLVAFLYPVLGFGTVAFGTICLAIYAPKRKRLLLGIVLLSALAQATANLMYAIDLMRSVYVVGKWYDGAWIFGFLLVPVAALWQMNVARAEQVSPAEQLTARQRSGEAFIPVVCIALVFSAGAAVGLPIYGLFYAAALPASAAFLVLFGLREQWILEDERSLRAQALASSRELSAVLESTTDSVAVVDRSWTITYLNRQAQSMLGSVEGFAIGSNLWTVFPDLVGTQFERKYEQAFETKLPVVFEEFLPKMGIWLQVHAFPHEDNLSIFFRDVTDKRLAQAQLEHLARHDFLTGLSNRLDLNERLSTVLGLSDDHQAAVLYLDLDHFKEVNDTQGHDAGDALLVEVARRIGTCTSSEYVARTGGDEFAILVPERSPRPRLQELANSLIDALSEPFHVNGSTVQIGASIGIAIAPEHGRTAEQLLKRADIALYAAKAAGRGTCLFFERSMETRLANRQAIKADLELALENAEFELFYQPVVDLLINRVTSFEALLRWRHPLRGLVPPADFIPLAEETGLITAIGAWALTEACAAAKMWPEEISIAVNLSSCEFGNPQLYEQVVGALQQSGLAPSRLELEITETVLMQDSDANLQLLKKLRDLGVGIALDDFGTGFSSLSYLRKFPFTKLKIDRSFVTHLEHEGESQAIVRAITSLGRSLGLLVTAEGVETRQQLDHVRREGCSSAQGYFFSKPVPQGEAVGLIKKINADFVWWATSDNRSGLIHEML